MGGEWQLLVGDDKTTAFAKVLDALPDDILIKVLRREVVVAPGESAREVMARVAHSPQMWTAAEMEAIRPKLEAFRNGTLEQRSDLVAWLACFACTVITTPTVVAPASISADTPFTVSGNLYGGDNGVGGSPNCPTVRHEIVVTDSADPNSNDCVIIESWASEVLDELAYSKTSCEISAAELTSLGSPASVKIWTRSYTCEDLSMLEDYDTATVS